GWVAVAPSDPTILYVGSGEGLPRPDLAVGDGIYRSADAGKTWAHLGLRDAQQIPKIAIDPKNPNRIFVAALGHPYGPNQERGIFRSRMVARRFRNFCIRMRTPAPLTWRSIRRTRKPFMRRFGPLASRLGKLEAARRSSPLAVEFLSPRMEARIGVR